MEVPAPLKIYINDVLLYPTLSNMFDCITSQTSCIPDFSKRHASQNNLDKVLSCTLKRIGLGRLGKKARFFDYPEIETEAHRTRSSKSIFDLGRELIHPILSASHPNLVAFSLVGYSSDTVVMFIDGSSHIECHVL